MFLTLFNTKELKRRRASERNGETSESDEKETERSISRACRVFDQHHQSHFIWSSRVAHLVDSKISQILSRPVIDLGQLQMYAGQERAGLCDFSTVEMDFLVKRGCGNLTTRKSCEINRLERKIQILLSGSSQLFKTEKDAPTPKAKWFGSI